MIDYTRH